jgi:hypothetical protein
MNWDAGTILRITSRDPVARNRTPKVGSLAYIAANPEENEKGMAAMAPGRVAIRIIPTIIDGTPTVTFIDNSVHVINGADDYFTAFVDPAILEVVQILGEPVI